MKIYGTIGPACQEEQKLEKMFRLGMTGMRLNVSHSSLEDVAEWIVGLHRAADSCNITADLLIDLQGPELRVGDFRFVESYPLKDGETIFLSRQDETETIPVPQVVLEDTKSGQEILLDDGKILLKVVSVQDNKVKCSVVRGGNLLPRKSIALPGKQMDTPTLTKADLDNIRLAKSYGVTGVMLPFVRGAQDIRNLRQTLQEAGASDIEIYAKIENFAGVEALNEIIDEADEVVIARGDLGNAMSLWELPAIQKKIADMCNARNRRFMVVTQMLASMEHSKVPTRAEVSDIFNAVLDGASSVMLTGETAAGEYPIEAMMYMVRTVKEAIKYMNE